MTSDDRHYDDRIHVYYYVMMEFVKTIKSIVYVLLYDIIKLLLT